MSEIVFEADITDVVVTEEARQLMVSGAYDDTTFGSSFALLKTYRLQPDELIREVCHRASASTAVVAAVRSDEKLSVCGTVQAGAR